MTNSPGFRVTRADNLPPCPHCHQPSIITVHIPAGDGIDLLLCPRCDTGNTPGACPRTSAPSAC